jgi:hypothetical protein
MRFCKVRAQQRKLSLLFAFGSRCGILGSFCTSLQYVTFLHDAQTTQPAYILCSNLGALPRPQAARVHRAKARRIRDAIRQSLTGRTLLILSFVQPCRSCASSSHFFGQKHCRAWYRSQGHDISLCCAGARKKQYSSRRSDSADGAVPQGCGTPAAALRVL